MKGAGEIRLLARWRKQSRAISRLMMRNDHSHREMSAAMRELSATALLIMRHSRKGGL